MIDKAERHLLGKSQANAVCGAKGVTATCLPTIQVSDIHKPFRRSFPIFARPRLVAIGISPLAVISPKASSGDVDVYPFCTIGDDVEIGEGRRSMRASTSWPA